MNYKKIRLAMANIFDEFVKELFFPNPSFQCILVQIESGTAAGAGRTSVSKSTSPTVDGSMVYLELRP